MVDFLPSSQALPRMVSFLTDFVETAMIDLCRLLFPRGTADHEKKWSALTHKVRCSVGILVCVVFCFFAALKMRSADWRSRVRSPSRMAFAPEPVDAEVEERSR